MPDYQMKVEVSFPEWDSLSNTQRSLINFFMKDAALYVIPEISETYVYGGTPAHWHSELSYNYSKLYGNIQSKVRCFKDRLYTYGSAPNMLTIPYCSTDISIGDTTYAGVQMEHELEFLQKSNQMILYNTDFGNANVTPITGIDYKSNITVNITPKLYVNNEWQENLNANIIPAAQSLMTAIPVNLEYSPSLEYKFQLRTSNFGILTYSNVLHKVYYKIGICPIDDHSLQECVNTLKSTTNSDGDITNGYEFNIALFQCCGYHSTIYTIENINDVGYANGEPSGVHFAFSYNNFYNPTGSGNNAYGMINFIPTRLIIPCELVTPQVELIDESNYNEDDDSESFSFILYAELYNETNGEPANLDLSEDSIMCLQVSEDGTEYVDDVVDLTERYTNDAQTMRLVITDNHLDDNAFIKTPRTPKLPIILYSGITGKFNAMTAIAPGEEKTFDSYVDTYSLLDSYYDTCACNNGELTVHINDNNNVLTLSVLNESDHNIEIRSLYIHIASTRDSTLHSVCTCKVEYNESHALYNAFVTYDGTITYYYVLDSNNYTWTDDLSSIGYSLVE